MINGSRSLVTPFLTGLEQGQRAQQEVMLCIVEADPVGAVSREVERLRIPRAELLGLLEQAHRDRLPVQAATGDGRVAIPRSDAGHDAPSLELGDAPKMRAMRAVVYDRYGPPEVLRIEEVERPVPLDDEVLVRVRAVAVTRADCATREANRRSGAGVSLLSRAVSGFRRPRQRILGSEFAGEVAEIGAAVTEFGVGDRVFGSTGFRFAAYAEFMRMPASARIAPMPAGMSFEDAAAICDGALNSLWALRGADLRKGQKILIYGASGAIGTAGVLLARFFEADVTAVCNTKNLALVRSLGADRVIDYTREDFTKNGETYDVIFDAVGKHSFRRCRSSLKPGGVYLPTDGLENLIRALWPTRAGDRKVVFRLPPRYTKKDVLFIKGLIEAGKYRSVIDRTYPLEEVIDAARYVETEQKTGNVVLKII